MKQTLPCLRCGTRMEYLKTEKLQLGQTSWVWGDLPNLFAGAMAVEVYICPNGRNREFYLGDGESDREFHSGIAQKTCPKCGLEHDLDDPKCPRCKHHYYR